MNPLHEAEREASREARRHATFGVVGHHHDMRPDGLGGGICACGDTVTADEL